MKRNLFDLFIFLFIDSSQRKKEEVKHIFISHLIYFVLKEKKRSDFILFR